MEDAGKMFNDGAAYERIMGQWSRKVGAPFLEWLAVPPGQSWLDVGCGNGAFSEVIQTQAAPLSLTGLDPSEGQIIYARNRTAAQPARFLVGDAQALPFGEAGFDAAVMALVIAFVPDPARAVAELARVTRPGGLVATYMWDLPGGGLPLAPLYRTMKSMGTTLDMPPSAEVSRREALAELWQGAHLQQVETQVIRIAVTFRDFEEFWNTMTPTVGPQAKVMAALDAPVRDELRQRLRASLPTAPDGSIAYESVANAVKGRVPG